MTRRKGTVRPESTEDERKKLYALKAGIGVEIGRLHRLNALLIAAQFAANHEAEFDVSDVISVAVEQVEQTLAALNLLELEARDV